MRRFCLVLSVATLIGWLLASAQADQKPDVDELIHRLGDHTFSVRAAAAKAIETLGPAALPALRRHKNDPNPGVRTQIATWIPRFEVEDLVAPRRVTLHARYRPLRGALEAIAKQAGYKLEVQDSSNHASRAYDFDFDNLPFWDAVDRICVRGNLSAQLTASSDATLSLTLQEGRHPHVVHCGAFRLSVSNLNYNLQRSVDVTSGGAVPGRGLSESFYVELMLQAEPRLHVFSVAVDQVAKAEDDRHRSLVETTSENAGTVAMIAARRPFACALGSSVPPSATSLNVALNPPSPGASSLKIFKGAVVVDIGKERHSQLLSDKGVGAKGLKRTLGKTTIQITDIRKTGDGYEVAFTVSGAYLALGDMEVTDADGRPLEERSGSVSNDGIKTEYRNTFTLPAPGAAPGKGVPVKFVWNWWDVVEYHVPFEFHDLPLP